MPASSQPPAPWRGLVRCQISSKFSVSAAPFSRVSPVKRTLTKPDATPHNLAIVQPGALEEVGMAGNEMAKSPDGAKKHFVPDDNSILHHTKLLDPDSVETLRFIAPRKPRNYPYVCTFPGHWVLMKGVIVVE